MLIYAAIGAFGLLFLLVTLVVGDLFGADHEVHIGDHDAGPSVLSARVVATFLVAFGVGGVIGRSLHLSPLASSAVGVATGGVLAGAVYKFAKLLHGQQASSELHMSSLVGQSGEVTVAIPDGGIGQVTIVYGGERATHLARSSDGHHIPVGHEVIITELRGEAVVVAPGTAASPWGS